MHSKIGFKSIIGTQKSVYWDFPVGKLEEQVMVSNLNVPPQQGFDSDGKACFSIGIHYLPAITFEERVVGTMPFCQSTAVATPFACMPTINNFKNNVFVKASAFEQLPESIERDSHNDFIEPPSFSGKSFEVFNRNASVKPQSHFSYFFDDFSKPVFDKVELFRFEFNEFSSCFETAFIRKGLQQSSAQHYLFSFYPNIFSKIRLFENFSFGRENGNCKAFGVGVDSQNIFSFWQSGFGFGEISNNLSAGSQSICLTFPASQNKRTEPLIVPVLFDWNSDSFSGVHSEFDKETGFGVEGFAVSRNIELDGESFDGCSFAFGNVTFNVANNLGVERGVFLAC